jgi:hypothetical protein
MRTWGVEGTRLIRRPAGGGKFPKASFSKVGSHSPVFGWEAARRIPLGGRTGSCAVIWCWGPPFPGVWFGAGRAPPCHDLVWAALGQDLVLGGPPEGRDLVPAGPLRARIWCRAGPSVLGFITEPWALGSPLPPGQDLVPGGPPRASIRCRAGPSEPGFGAGRTPPG